MKRSISFGAAGAAATAAMLWLGVPAGAAAGPAVSGTENFQLVTTSATATTVSVIAAGVFTAGGVDHVGNKVDTLVFPAGSVKIAHSDGTGKQTLNPKTCLLTAKLHGTIKLSGGTGKYAGISGNGTYRLSILAIAARTAAGKCTMKKPPVSFQQIINASAQVNL